MDSIGAIESQDTFECPHWHCKGWTLDKCLKRQKIIRGKQGGGGDVIYDWNCLKCSVGKWIAAKRGIELEAPVHDLSKNYVPNIAMGDSPGS